MYLSWRTMGVILLWGSLCVVGVWSLTGPDKVTVPSGEEMTVQCVYDAGYEDYIKYWCKGESWKHCQIVVSTTTEKKEVTNGRYSIKDTTSNLHLSVIMTDTKPADSDTYFCGVERSGNDIMHNIVLQVLPGVCNKTAPWTDIVDFPSNFPEIQENRAVEVSCQTRYEKKTFRLQCRGESREFLLSPEDDQSSCVERCGKLKALSGNITLSPDQEYYDPGEEVTVICPPGFEPNFHAVGCIRWNNTNIWNVTDVSCLELGVCNNTAPWTDIVDFPSNVTEIQENSSVEVSCQQRYEKKTFRLRCREESGEFLLSPEDDGGFCVGICNKTAPWTDIVDFPSNVTEIQENSSVEVSCQQRYEKKTFRLRCREESGEFLLSPEDAGGSCVGICNEKAPWTDIVDFLPNFTEMKENSSAEVSCQKRYEKKTFRLQCREESGEFLLTPEDDQSSCVERCGKLKELSRKVTLSPDQEYYDPGEEVTVICPPGFEPNFRTVGCMKRNNINSWNVTNIFCLESKDVTDPMMVPSNWTKRCHKGSFLESSWFTVPLSILLTLGAVLVVKILYTRRRRHRISRRGMEIKGPSDSEHINLYEKEMVPAGPSPVPAGPSPVPAGPSPRRRPWSDMMSRCCPGQETAIQTTGDSFIL